MGIGHGRPRGIRGAGRQAGRARHSEGRRGRFWQDLAVEPKETPSSFWEEAEQLKRELAAAREEVAELQNRLKELETE